MSPIFDAQRRSREEHPVFDRGGGREKGTRTFSDTQRISFLGLPRGPRIGSSAAAELDYLGRIMKVDP
jgi:hypothetical protein